ncbi:MAG: hypothetical protein ACJAQ6_000765 [Arenicella sp.]
MLNENSQLKKFTVMLIYLVIGIAASMLFSYLSELYVVLFGETYTPTAKLVASTMSLLVCLFIVFTANHICPKLDSMRLGIALSLVMFTWLYIVGPGVRAPVTLYMTSVSFPYNINLLATIVLPLVIAWALLKRDTKNIQ